MKKKTEKLPASGIKDKNFFEDVWEVVRLVPRGRVTTYGAIAHYLGTRMSARMVGWAMNSSHLVRPKVPAQRVVNRNGMLTGKQHFSSPTEMEELLAKDGVNVKDDLVLNFSGPILGPFSASDLNYQE